MATIQLNPPLWLQTPRGPAIAHIYHTNGLEGDSTWVCFGEDGQIWEYSNYDVRAYKNETLGRLSPEKPHRKAETVKPVDQNIHKR